MAHGETNGGETSIRSPRTFLFILSIPLTFFGLSIILHTGRISLVTALNERERNSERDQKRSAGRRLVSTRTLKTLGIGCASLRGGDPGPNWTALWFSPRC